MKSQMKKRRERRTVTTSQKIKSEELRQIMMRRKHLHLFNQYI